MSVISTAGYWKYRGTKIPPAYGPMENPADWRPRNIGFDTDAEVINKAVPRIGPRQREGKNDMEFLLNRRAVLRRDNYTCTRCGYVSTRGKNGVHDLEVHHKDNSGGNGIDNLETVCLDCHRKLKAIS
jgi:hypothetical protein